MQFKRTNIEYDGRDKYGISGNGSKIRKKSFVYGVSSAGGFGGGSIGPMPATGNTHNYTVDCSTSVPLSNILASDLTMNGYVVNVPIYGFANNDNTEVWVGTFDGNASNNFGISGCTNGLSATSITNNGTIEPVLNLKFTSNLTMDSGELQIPIHINSSPYLQVFTGSTEWSEMDTINKLTPKIITYCWNIKSAGGGTGYILDLSNEYATVNADANGIIYTASTATLDCTAALYYNNTVDTAATYAITATTATGVSINSSTGVLTFANNFSFAGYYCTIDITASVNGTVKGSKTMRINKVKDGADGTGGVRRWIVPSANVTVLGIDSSVTPSVVTATVMKQTSGNAPEVDNTTKIFYGYSPGQLNPTIQMPSTGLTIDSTVEYVVLALREGDVYNGTIYEQETVHMIAEGTGPTIRGPIRWRAQLARRFSNGVGPQIGDREWIDVVRYGTHSYKCTTSYTQSAGSTWASVSENWTQDDSYNFVASELELSTNTNIQMRPDNELQVVNNNGTVVGGWHSDQIWLGGTMASNGATRLDATGVTSSNMTSEQFKKKSERQTGFVVPFVPFQIEINIIHDNADKDDFISVDFYNNWTVAGNSIGISSEEYPYMRMITRDDEYNQDYMYNFVLSNSPTPVPDEEIIPTGVVSSDVEKQSNIMYLTM